MVFLIVPPDVPLIAFRALFQRSWDSVGKLPRCRHSFVHRRRKPFAVRVIRFARDPNAKPIGDPEIAIIPDFDGANALGLHPCLALALQSRLSLFVCLVAPHSRSPFQKSLSRTQSI
jgi:hypothetical protein